MTLLCDLGDQTCAGRDVYIIHITPCKGPLCDQSVTSWNQRGPYILNMFYFRKDITPLYSLLYVPIQTPSLPVATLIIWSWMMRWYTYSGSAVRCKTAQISPWIKKIPENWELLFTPEAHVVCIMVRVWTPATVVSCRLALAQCRNSMKFISLRYFGTYGAHMLTLWV